MALDRTGLKHPALNLLDLATAVDAKSAGQQWQREWEAARAKALEQTRAVRAESNGVVPGSSGRTEAGANEMHASLRSPGAAVFESAPGLDNRPAALNPRAGYGGSVMPEEITGTAAGRTAARTSAATAVVLQVLDAEAPGPGSPVAQSDEGALAVAKRWSRANMHLQSTEEGVIVWLRDTEISQTQVRNVLERLGRQLAQAGFKLHQLHINGKAVYGGDSSSRNDQT